MSVSGKKETTSSATALTSGPELLYGIDDIPPPLEAATLGFQHYLTMFGSTIAVPLIMAGPLGISNNPVALTQLISTMFFVSGIATLLQSTFGNRLPIIQGGTFSFLAPAIAICGSAALKDQGYAVKMHHIQGAVIAGAFVQMGFGYLGLVGRLLKFVGPITIAPTIALIGLSLFNFGAPEAGRDWWIGGLTIILIILFSQYLRKTHRAFELFPILLAIVGAWAVAAALSQAGVFAPNVLDPSCIKTLADGSVEYLCCTVKEAGHPSYVDTCKLAVSPWFSIPYPFQWGVPVEGGAEVTTFGWPVFSAAAIVGLLAGVIASMVESIGDYYAAARLSGAPVPTAAVVNKGIGMEGIGCLVAGIFGTGNGTTSYSENIGAIGLTRVGSRRVVQAGAIIMLILAVFGKFGGLFTTIPQPIVGGMYCAMFGMIAAVGLSNLQYVDLNSGRNLFILGFAFFMGLSVPAYFGKVPFEGLWFVGWGEYLSGFVGPTGPLVAGVGALLKAVPDVVNTLGKTGMAIGALIALVLDNTIPGTREERGLTHWDAPEDESVHASHV